MSQITLRSMNTYARPVGYLRKSRELAARNGDAELQLLSDWNRSGRKTASRPDYLRLRKMVEAGEVSVLYAYSLSRLARSLTEYSHLVEVCRQQQVTIRLAKEGE